MWPHIYFKIYLNYYLLVSSVLYLRRYVILYCLVLYVYAYSKLMHTRVCMYVCMYVCMCGHIAWMAYYLVCIMWMCGHPFLFLSFYLYFILISFLYTVFILFFVFSSGYITMYVALLIVLLFTSINYFKLCVCHSKVFFLFLHFLRFLHVLHFLHDVLLHYVQQV